MHALLPLSAALPRRPDGTDDYDEKQLTALVTRAAMIGVAHPSI
ncbi:MAG: nitrile hydratase subunit alpha [Reyranella sp.]